MCLLRFQSKGVVDATLDESLLRYLALRERPHDLGEARRVLRASEFISMDDAGALWVSASGGGITRQIPPIAARSRIVEVTFRQCAYPSGDKLYQCLKEHYYWNGMKADCSQHAALSLVR